MQSYKITTATFPRDQQAITSLFTAYTSALGLDLTFQDYKTEVNSLPGKYAAEQGGCLLVARAVHSPHPHGNNNDIESEDGELLGCVAYRALPSVSTTENENGKRYCEMKRLYLTPASRGLGIGTKLVEAIIAHAKESTSSFRYAGMRLDTLPSAYMASARELYKRYGFVEVEQYYETPLEGTIFMGLEF